MIWIAVSLLSIILISNIVGFVISAPGYNGEKTDHFDGKTFKNLGGIKAKGFKDVLTWSFNRDQGEWKKIESLAVYPEIQNRLNDGEWKVTFVNHSTFLLQIGEMNILTDPIWSERTSPVQFAGPQRFVPPGIKFEGLPPIDVVIISHNHYDHLDVSTVKRLEKEHSPQFYTPLGVSQFLIDLGIKISHDMDWWEETGISDSIGLVCVPAQHFSGRGTFDRDKTLWAGFVIKTNSGKIYFAGDTGYGEFFKTIGDRLGPFELSMIPIGAYKPSWFMSPIHISPQEAVKVHQDVRSKKSISMHFGTFPLADDGIDDPTNDLKKGLKMYGVSEEDFLVLGNGEQYAVTFSN